MIVSFIKFALQRCLPATALQGLRAAFHRWRDRVALRRSMAYDHRRFADGAGLFRAETHAPSIEASLIKAYHRIEKGLALREPRPGFGRDAVEAVLLDAQRLLACLGPQRSVTRALAALDEYVHFHLVQGVDLAWLLPRLTALRQAQGRSAIAGEGGTVLVERARIHAAARLDLADFFARRHSIRQFSAEPVAAVLVAQAVAMAQKTPSVCNRESGMVHAAFEPGIKERLLALQNGTRGFGDQAGCVLVVTSRLDTFLSVGERYQGWIDGGMFAMSLVYALHSLGLGSCCLNWSVEPEADIALRRVGGIPDDQLVIMLLAVGHLPERLRVAQSPRRPLDDVLKIL
jgi:nitroreductase